MKSRAPLIITAIVVSISSLCMDVQANSQESTAKNTIEHKIESQEFQKVLRLESSKDESQKVAAGAIGSRKLIAWFNILGFRKFDLI